MFLRIFSFLALLCFPLCALQHDFILQDVDSGEVIAQQGDLTLQMSPYCSFNIALSLMGYDAQILQNCEYPVLPYNQAYEEGLDFFPSRWKQSHYPLKWMRNSCVWYSRFITQAMGFETLQSYVTSFGYGNEDLVSEPNGLIQGWIGSSLRISPLEQIDFIAKMLNRTLPLSADAYEKTKILLFTELLPDNMILYGKTGGGSYAFGHFAPSVKVGWFVGWLERAGRQFALVSRVSGDDPNELINAFVAKALLKEKIAFIFN